MNNTYRCWLKTDINLNHDIYQNCMLIIYLVWTCNWAHMFDLIKCINEHFFSFICLKTWNKNVDILVVIQTSIILLLLSVHVSFLVADIVSRCINCKETPIIHLEKTISPLILSVLALFSCQICWHYYVSPNEVFTYLAF